MDDTERLWRANIRCPDGFVHWHNDPFGRPFKAQKDHVLHPILAFGCDRETNGGPVCAKWCGSDNCAVSVAAGVGASDELKGKNHG